MVVVLSFLPTVDGQHAPTSGRTARCWASRTGSYQVTPARLVRAPARPTIQNRRQPTAPGGNWVRPPPGARRSWPTGHRQRYTVDNGPGGHRPCGPGCTVRRSSDGNGPAGGGRAGTEGWWDASVAVYVVRRSGGPRVGGRSGAAPGPWAGPDRGARGERQPDRLEELLRGDGRRPADVRHGVPRIRRGRGGRRGRRRGHRCRRG